MKEIFIGSSKEGLEQATEVAPVLSEALDVKPRGTALYFLEKAYEENLLHQRLETRMIHSYSGDKEKAQTAFEQARTFAEKLSLRLRRIPRDTASWVLFLPSSVAKRKRSPKANALSNCRRNPRTPLMDRNI